MLEVFVVAKPIVFLAGMTVIFWKLSDPQVPL